MQNTLTGRHGINSECLVHVNHCANSDCAMHDSPGTLFGCLEHDFNSECVVYGYMALILKVWFMTDVMLILEVWRRSTMTLVMCAWHDMNGVNSDYVVHGSHGASSSCVWTWCLFPRSHPHLVRV
jgi:hypothetical protein